MDDQSSDPVLIDHIYGEFWFELSTRALRLSDRLRASIIERQKVGLPIDPLLESTLERFLAVYAAAYCGNKDYFEELKAWQMEISGHDQSEAKKLRR